MLRRRRLRQRDGAVTARPYSAGSLRTPRWREHHHRRRALPLPGGSLPTRPRRHGESRHPALPLRQRGRVRNRYQAKSVREHRDVGRQHHVRRHGEATRQRDAAAFANRYPGEDSGD